MKLRILTDSALDMCIDALESMTNSLSSGFIKDGTGRHHSLEGEKK